jgi:hypothetical protein
MEASQPQQLNSTNRRRLFAFKRTCDSRRRVSAGLTNRVNPPEPSNAGRAPLVKRAQHLPHSSPIPLTPVIPAVRSTVYFCFRSLPPRHYVSITCASRRPEGDTTCHPKHILRIQPLLPEPVTTRIRVGSWCVASPYRPINKLELMVGQRRRTWSSSAAALQAMSQLSRPDRLA